MGTPIGYEKITVSTVVKTFTTATYAEALTALVTVEDAPIRWTVDGTAPDNASDGAAETGHLAPAGTTIRLENRHEVVGFKALRQDGANDAAIFCSFGV